MMHKPACIQFTCWNMCQFPFTTFIWHNFLLFAYFWVFLNFSPRALAISDTFPWRNFSIRGNSLFDFCVIWWVFREWLISRNCNQSLTCFQLFATFPAVEKKNEIGNEVQLEFCLSNQHTISDRNRYFFRRLAQTETIKIESEIKSVNCCCPRATSPI